MYLMKAKFLLHRMIIFNWIILVLQVEKIKHIGGGSEGEYIRNVLREIMIKEVAEHYSWSGQSRPQQTESKKKF